ncbi:MAG: NfeD family protein [Clostridia bacterium]|nr:NfeD family protein [Clostridia bacterium]
MYNTRWKGGGNTGEYDLFIWIALAVIFAVAEAVTVQLVTVWFAVGAVGAVVANILGASPIVQTAVFVALSVLTLIISRPFVKKFTKTKIQPTNADMLIGETAVVTQSIDNLRGEGTVTVRGIVWTARSSDNSPVDEGEMVTVVKIEGAKLIVKKKKDNQEE